MKKREKIENRTAIARHFLMDRGVDMNDPDAVIAGMLEFSEHFASWITLTHAAAAFGVGELRNRDVPREEIDRNHWALKHAFNRGLRDGLVVLRDTGFYELTRPERLRDVA